MAGATSGATGMRHRLMQPLQMALQFVPVFGVWLGDALRFV
jgi:hypothetical protein